ncbi:MAG: OadG family transporter subunit [Anaerolineales bacterium]
MNLYAQGLTLSLMGMLVTFASLGLLILIIVLLQRMFGGAQPAAAPSTRPEPAANHVLPINENADDAQLAAAIAVAMALQSDQHRSGELGAALTEGRGRWWSLHDVNRSSQLPRQSNRRVP